VYDYVNLANICLDAIGNLRDGPFCVSGISLVISNVLRDIFDGVEDSIHGVDMSEFHQRAVGELSRFVKFATTETGLEDVQGWHPHTDGNLSTSFSKTLGNSPSEALQSYRRILINDALWYLS